MEVKFYDKVDEKQLKFAVIIAKYNNQWVFCRHKERKTFECPGGHREPGEAIEDTAKRELYEETGAMEYMLKPLCVYSVSGSDPVINNAEETFGMLYYADIKKFGILPDYEIEEVLIQKELPEQWTYPYIQPKLLERVASILG